jgi:hypothetical protein
LQACRTHLLNIPLRVSCDHSGNQSFNHPLNPQHKRQVPLAFVKYIQFSFHVSPIRSYCCMCHSFKPLSSRRHRPSRSTQLPSLICPLHNLSIPHCRPPVHRINAYRLPPTPVACLQVQIPPSLSNLTTAPALLRIQHEPERWMCQDPGYCGRSVLDQL